jgi:hypothetical protein
VDEGFLRPENSQLVLVASTPEYLLEKLMEWEPPTRVEKWLDREKR